MIVGVLVELSNKNIDRVFDYNVPSSLAHNIKLGVRVVVPFGAMKLDGFIVEVKDTSNFSELKDIISIKDNSSILNRELLELGKWMSEDLLCTLISSYQVMLPKALKANISKNYNKKYDIYYKIGKIDDNLTKTSYKILELFKDRELVSRKECLSVSSSVLKKLVDNGVLIEERIEKYRVKYSDNNKYNFVLTDKQKSAYRKIIDSNLVSLLYGVTGSGKTEVYMELINYYLKDGRSAIVLVPEISLTPQMISRFEARFGSKIAALHSGLSDGEKYDEWRRIERGEASIVIGARSAIFAPLKDIGIIIVDEEHSNTYKQTDMNPRYDARDIAKWRGKYHNAKVVFGSATPSLESMARGVKGVYNLVTISERVNGKSLPIVNIVDMNKHIKDSIGSYSTLLIDAIKKRIKNNEQVILLINRRGYSNVVSCRKCGYTYKCPNCDIAMTYHKSNDMLRCHYCGYATKLDKLCPSCSSDALKNIGTGTEKAVEELEKIVEARIVRMDFDTTSRKGAHQKIIDDFKNHKYDILLGTQVVAKGLDFPLVTLVGVINADTSLNLPDFRASEDTFSLLSQVAGRSGRSELNGEVIIQTYNPDNYAIVSASKHDYLAFYNREMAIRKMMKYPPYYYLCYIRVSGKDSLEVFNQANKIKQILESRSHNLILGPTPCSIYKLNNVYRYGILIKYRKDDNLKLILNEVIEHYVGSKIKVDIDFNPREIL